MAKEYILNRPNSKIDDRWLGLGDLNGKLINNPLLNRTDQERDNPGLLEMRLMRDPRYLSFPCKVLLGIDLLPMQAAILEQLWTHPFPMLIMSRGGGKSFLLAVYATLRCLLIPGTKVVGVGAGFRQSKIIYDYMVSIYNNAPVMRSVLGQSSGPKTHVDRCMITFNDSTATFTPLGDGKKVRGLRANVIIADEFQSISPEIYETVISGFASVRAKPIDHVRAVSREEGLKEEGLWTEEMDAAKDTSGNQCIISGTPGYGFEHYADYWRKHWVYIKGNNDPDKLIKLPIGGSTSIKESYQGEEVPEAFNSDDYTIIRIPYKLIPKGFMDEKVITKAKGTSNAAIYEKEYCAVFPEDSDGFFKRSLIESCVVSEARPVELPSGKICFDAVVSGDPSLEYVYGVDPASQSDNLSIVVLELHKDHSRIVYGWSTNMKNFQRRKAAGMVSETDYYGFVARKIRDLMTVFPTNNIAMDAQGGGIAVLEALHDERKIHIEKGEVPIWATNKILNPDKELETDYHAGLHIVHMCQFANAEFTACANHWTKKDFEDKVLLFPRFDSATLELSAQADLRRAKDLGVDINRLYDTSEDCVMEIEELKDELSTIVMSRVGAGAHGRERWDTPEGTTIEGKKIKLRKDRYSALIMANFIAHKIFRTSVTPTQTAIGGFAHQIAGRKDKSDKPMYSGPEWFNTSNQCGIGITRR